LVDTMGSRRPVMAGIATMAVAVFAMGHLTTTTPLWVIGTLLAVQGAGMGLGMSPLMVAGMSDLPPGLIARGSAVRSLNSQIAGAISVAALGALVSSRLGSSPTPEQAVAGYNAAFIACSASLLVALALASRLPSRPRGAVDAEAVLLAE
jgi:MFS family permease